MDQALCFGWIDAVRRRRDDESYTIRFTHRRPRSTWSAVNVRRFAELEALGQVHEAGRAAFARRREDRTGTYAYEQVAPAELRPGEVTALRADPEGWAFWQAQPAGYRRTATHWVVSAKRAETRTSRFATLLADCAAGLRIKQLRR